MSWENHEPVVTRGFFEQTWLRHPALSRLKTLVTSQWTQPCWWQQGPRCSRPIALSLVLTLGICWVSSLPFLSFFSFLIANYLWFFLLETTVGLSHFSTHHNLTPSFWGTQWKTKVKKEQLFRAIPAFIRFEFSISGAAVSSQEVISILHRVACAVWHGSQGQGKSNEHLEAVEAAVWDARIKQLDRSPFWDGETRNQITTINQ